MQLYNELEYIEEQYSDSNWEYYPPSKQRVSEWLKDYSRKILKLYGVDDRMTPTETQNILRKPLFVQISSDLKEILSKEFNYDYSTVKDKKFTEKYTGQKTWVYEWCGDWWIAEDDNYPITRECFTKITNNVRKK